MTKVIARRLRPITASDRSETSYVKGFHPHKFHRAMIHMGYKPATPHGSHRELVHEAKQDGYSHSYSHPTLHGVVSIKKHGNSHTIGVHRKIGPNVSHDHETKLKNHDHLHAWHDSYVHEE